MQPTVFLADLRYNYTGVLANDCMPLGVAYMKAVMDRDLPEVQSRLFAYPDRLWEALRTSPPDVLMLSNYCWNEALSLHFAKLAKRISPDTLVVMGGPNFPIEEDRQLAYLRRHPELDIYILGEGDFLATEVVRLFLDASLSTKKLGTREIPSSVYRLPDGEPALQKMWARHKEMDDIPSPWLTGIQDEFFDGKLAPMMETNRGCPFTCTFCVQGTGWYTKVNNFSLQRIKEEIEYVGRRVREVSPNMGVLRIADSNYGMFERDIEISAFLGEVMKKHGWPKFIDATTGKNRPDRVIASMEKVSGALILYQSVQSLDENVLRNVKRTTIKLKAYEELLVHMRGRGMRSHSDLILGLPGESLQSHVEGIHKLLDTGVHQTNNFQLMMLKGSELETLDSRNMFSFETRFRVLPKNFGIYGGEKVFDVEEIVVATDTLPFDDYVEARKYALASNVFWHDDQLEDVLTFAACFGVKRSEWLNAILPAMENDDGPVRKLLDGFVYETIHELFPTREACIEFYSQEDNFQRLLNGDIGDNVVHKYHAISSFHIWPAVCKLAMDVTKRLLVAHGAEREIPRFDEFWSDFHSYIEVQHVQGHTREEILAPARANLRYDISPWLADGAFKNVEAYRLDEPQEYEFRLSDEALEGLQGLSPCLDDGDQGIVQDVDANQDSLADAGLRIIGSGLGTVSSVPFVRRSYSELVEACWPLLNVEAFRCTEPSTAIRAFSSASPGRGLDNSTPNIA